MKTTINATDASAIGLGATTTDASAFGLGATGVNGTNAPNEWPYKEKQKLPTKKNCAANPANFFGDRRARTKGAELGDD